MKNDSNKYTLSFAEALALLFIALKLCHVISWPWLWVLSPLWIGAALVAVVAIVVALVKS